MPIIKFLKNRPSIEVPSGAKLMQSLLEKDIAVASSCGGEGVCCKCVLRVIEGAQNLSKANELEQDLKDINDLGRNERVSCQVEVLGDITLDADYW